VSEEWWASVQPAAAPSMPDFEGMFNQACDQINNAVKTVVDKFNALIQHIHDNRYLLGPVLLVLKGIMDRIRDVVDKAVQLTKYVAEHYVPVLSLIMQSFHWVNHVLNPMSNLSGPVGRWREDNQNSRYWTGAAADAYKDVVTGQKAAVDEYVKKSEFISKWLFSVAQTNVDYVCGLGNLIAKLAGEMVTTTAEGATVIELPFAADRLASALSTAIEGGLNMLIEYAKNFVRTLGDIRDAASQQGDHTVFTDGQWPQAVRN
jgi:hypothetical protein